MIIAKSLVEAKQLCYYPMGKEAARFCPGRDRSSAWFTRTNFHKKICAGEERNIVYYVYILRSLKDKKLYAGYSNNLKRRFEEHNKGEIKSTKNRKPFTLIYYESYLHQQDATEREKLFKTQWGRNYLRRVLKNYWKQMGS